MNKDEKNEKLPEQAGWPSVYPPSKPTPKGPLSLHDLAYHSEADQLYSAITKIIDQCEHELQDGTQHYSLIKHGRRNLANTIRGILRHELRTTP